MNEDRNFSILVGIVIGSIVVFSVMALIYEKRTIPRLEHEIETLKELTKKCQAEKEEMDPKIQFQITSIALDPTIRRIEVWPYDKTCVHELDCIDGNCGKWEKVKKQ